MSYNGSGTFNINSAGQPVVTGTVISSTAFNALTADLGTGLSTAITKDGQTVATARIPFAAGINSSLVTDATNTTTGSIITAGGVGIAKALFVGTTANIAGTTTLAGVTATSITDSGLTAGRVTYAGTAGLLQDSANLTFSGSALAVTGTLTSTGNLGAGIASPAYRLDVRVTSTGNVANFQSDSGPNIRFTGTETSGRTYQVGEGLVTAGSFSIYDSTGSAERLVIDSSGNLGLGVTPSAWGGSTIGLEVNTGSALSGYYAGGVTAYSIWGNAVVSGGVAVYKVTGRAFQQTWDSSAGATSWNIAASGTAGNAITFTQAMTLDASGNLLVGTTSQNGIITAVGSSQISHKYTGSSSVLFIGQYNSSGDASINNTANGPLVLATNNTERARIDSSGNLVVNGTAAGVTNNDAFWTSTSAYFGQNHTNGTSNGTNYAYFAYNGSTIGSITQSGTAAVLYNVTSDQRLKENIVDAPEFGSVIDSIQVRSYDWITDQTHQRAGFIAQELVTVVPEAVHQPADPDDMMAVDYSKLVPMLVKEIQSLRKRITALEAK